MEKLNTNFNDWSESPVEFEDTIFMLNNDFKINLYPINEEGNNDDAPSLLIPLTRFKKFVEKNDLLNGTIGYYSDEDRNTECNITFDQLVGNEEELRTSLHKYASEILNVKAYLEAKKLKNQFNSLKAQYEREIANLKGKLTLSEIQVMNLTNELKEAKEKTAIVIEMAQEYRMTAS